MVFNPSPQVAVARAAAKTLKADMGAIVIYLDSKTGVNMASFGHNRALCTEMGKLGDHLYEAARDYFKD